MKTRYFVRLARLGLILVVMLAVLPVQGVLAAGTRRYARPGGATSGDCLTWKTACELRYVLGSVTVAGDQVWVRAGVYTPDGASRSNSFVLQSGVAIYGGFAGGETLLSQRKPALNVTLLSGDIGWLGDSSDNSYHVVTSNGADATALLDGFTITAGNANGTAPDNDGGGMFNTSSSPTLRNLTFSGNAAANNGGGMANSAGSSPVLSRVTFTANAAGQNGGGMSNGANSNPKLTGVNFNGNMAGIFAGGMYNESSSPVLKSTRFSGNWAGQQGGGMYNNNGNPALTKVNFSGNGASNLGGGMYNWNSNPTLNLVTFSYNTSGTGGGMENDNGSSPVLNRVTFSNNTADNDGGGMENRNNSSPSLRNVTFTGNTASYGGGMYGEAGSPILIGVTFSGNSASSDGGGLYSWNSIFLRNVTFSMNSAGGDGGGLYSGGVSSGSTSLVLNNVTMSGNTAGTSGGAVFNDSGSDLAAHNSIFWGNGTSEIYNNGSTVTLDYSILKGGCPLGDTSFTCTRVLNKNPLLGPLAKNGGFTRTMALLVGSPAIDHGNNTTCEHTDQRGVARPQGLRCDIGAYELVP